MAEFIYSYSDYKTFIKDRIKFLKTKKPYLSLRYLSDKLEIQYTFLSKVLNSENNHLSEDHLFKASEILELLPDEMEFLLLLRSHQATNSSSRKAFLEKKISVIQKNNILSVDRMKSSNSYFADEMNYLMEHFATVVHVALGIKNIRNDPLKLTHYLKIDQTKLKSILDLLDRLGLIEYSNKNHKVIKTNTMRLHYGKDHPLTRTNQMIMKSHLNQLSFIKSELEKENLFVTFTTDKVGFAKVKNAIHNFIKEVQKISMDNQHNGVYQLNIDFVELFNLK